MPNRDDRLPHTDQKPDASRHARRRGCMLGLAIGDALRAAVEFKSRGSFPPVTGYRDGGPHPLAAGEWTDDTSAADSARPPRVHVPSTASPSDSR